MRNMSTAGTCFMRRLSGWGETYWRAEHVTPCGFRHHVRRNHYHLVSNHGHEGLRPTIHSGRLVHYRFRSELPRHLIWNLYVSKFVHNWRTSLPNRWQALIFRHIDSLLSQAIALPRTVTLHLSMLLSQQRNKMPVAVQSELTRDFNSGCPLKHALRFPRPRELSLDSRLECAIRKRNRIQVGHGNSAVFEWVIRSKKTFSRLKPKRNVF